jgi:hypothetical protein
MKNSHTPPARSVRSRLRRTVLAACAGLTLTIVALLSWPLPATPNPGVAGDVLVRNVSVIDVVNARTIPARDVVIRDGRIVRIEATGGDAAPAGLRVIDGAGTFLMPSLWDMHVHSLKISPQYTHPLSIANGVTGVREMWSCPGIPDPFVACGDDIQRWRAALPDRRQLAPRYILRSSYAINGPLGVPASAPAFFMARDARDADTLVAYQKAQGVDLLKIYTNVSVDAYDAIAAAASARDLVIAGHLPVRVSLERAIAARQRSIEHPRLFLFECFRDAAAFRALPDPAAAFTIHMRARFVDEHDAARCAERMAAMAASDMWWTPTVQVLRMSARAGDSTFRNDPRQRYIPYLFWSVLWRADADGAVAAAAAMPGRAVDAQLYQLAMDNVRQAHQAGVKLVAGTDAGDSYVFPGFAIHDELVELVRAGLTPAAALRSTTIDAARFSGHAHEFGSVEVGKVADLVLLDGNPLLDIRHTRRIRAVFFNGQYFDRAALDALLSFAEAQAGSLRLNLQLVWAAVRSPILRAQAAD